MEEIRRVYSKLHIPNLYNIVRNCQELPCVKRGKFPYGLDMHHRDLYVYIACGVVNAVVQSLIVLMIAATTYGLCAAWDAYKPKAYNLINQHDGEDATGIMRRMVVNDVTHVDEDDYVMKLLAESESDDAHTKAKRRRRKKVKRKV